MRIRAGMKSEAQSDRFSQFVTKRCCYNQRIGAIQSRYGFGSRRATDNGWQETQRDMELRRFNDTLLLARAEWMRRGRPTHVSITQVV